MEKTIITFSANEQKLIKTGGIECYASNIVSYIEAHFDLGANWSGYDSVRAVWSNDNNMTVISTVLDSNGVCVVPFEVLKTKGIVKVNLVGSISVSDVLTDRLTSFPCEAVKVTAKAKIEGSETAPITPSQFEQFVAAVISEVEKVTGMTAQAETLPAGAQATARYENGILYLGIPQGIQGERGETGADGNGIASVVYNADYSLTLVFDNGEQFRTPPIRGERGPAGADGRDGTDGRDGADGVTPSLSVGTVTTLPSTEDAYVTRTGTDENPVFNFGIPQGPKGNTGEVSLQELEDATVVQTLSDNTPYNFRRTNNGQGSGHREYDEIVGASVGWNQLVDSSSTSVTVQSGHKYYANIGGTKTIALSNGSAISVSGGTDTVVDLTLMNSQIADYVYTLETATAGSGVAWLKSHFPKLFDNGYQPFDSGSIKSVSGLTAHEMVGVNQWDEEWELGQIDTTTGANTSSSTQIRSKNFVRVLPNTTYYFKTPNAAWALPYDSDNNLIAGAYMTSSHSANASQLNGAFTTPNGCHYIRFYLPNSYGTTYKNDICINLSSDRNGQYEPYIKHTYPLDSSLTLRGIYKMDASHNLYADGDVYESDGTVTRKYGVVDLGTLTWSALSASNTFAADAIETMKIAGVVGSAQNGLICAKYTTLSNIAVASDMADKSVSVGAGTKRIMVHDSAYSDASAFKTAMNGVQLCYELATPTTETADPYTNPQQVESGGTEEYVSDSIIPIGHSTDYPMTLGDTMPKSNGTYTMSVTVSNGKKTINWT